MARKSVKKERRLEILTAFERCISRYGMAGSSLERIADECNIKRPALRHFVGNRDEIIIDLCVYINDQAEQGRVSIDKVMPDTADEFITMIKGLLVQQMTVSGDRANTIVALAGHAQTQQNPKVRAAIKKWHEDYYKWISKSLCRYYKNTNQIDAVSILILNAVMAHCAMHGALPATRTSAIVNGLELILSTLTPLTAKRS